VHLGAISIGYAVPRIDNEAGAREAGVEGALEQKLLAICQAALPNRKLSPDDNLFEIGTGSLTLAQIYERVEAEYPGQLEVTDFFEYPTVRAMAGFLARRLRAWSPGIAGWCTWAAGSTW